MGGSTWGSGCQVELDGGESLADGARKYTAKISPKEGSQKFSSLGKVEYMQGNYEKLKKVEVR
jgi:hypothetical protein